VAKRRKRRSSRSKPSGYPPVIWMLFGLAIGLSVAFAVYINGREPATVAKQSAPQPASMQATLDDNGETRPVPEPAPARKDKRFTFYDILPNVEILTGDSTMQAPADSTPKAVEEPGMYVLQAGSFSTNADADRRRAELALQGIESHIQRVKVNDRNYHRVYIGPTDDLDELNMLRSRLRAAQIDVLRIRVSD